MKCPRCDSELRETDFRDFVKLDTCPSCKGCWFDEGELDHLDDSMGSNAELLSYKPAKTEHDKLSCPRCQKTLAALSPPEDLELVIDRCTDCHGFWLDEGELDRVRVALLKADSELNAETELLIRPVGWSWTKWVMYRFWRSYSSDLEAAGKAGGLAHRT